MPLRVVDTKAIYDAICREALLLEEGYAGRVHLLLSEDGGIRGAAYNYGNRHADAPTLPVRKYALKLGRKEAPEWLCPIHLWKAV